MNAHKDTQHPAGQVINEEASQKTLSDYIRSIKRAEAFDQVAQEKKVTFEEWVKDHQKYYSASEYMCLKTGWYAALANGKVS